MCCFKVNGFLIGFMIILGLIIIGIFVCSIIDIVKKYSYLKKKVDREFEIREKYINEQEFDNIKNEIEEISEKIKEIQENLDNMKMINKEV